MASPPLIVVPPIVIVLLDATALVANEPKMPVVERVTASAGMTPLSVAVEVSSREVASVVASYSRSSAVMLRMVSSF